MKAPASRHVGAGGLRPARGADARGHPLRRPAWKPRPDFATAAEAWLEAGGPHRTVLCRAIGSEAFADLARIVGLELVVIDGSTRLGELANELRWNEAYHLLARGAL